MSKEFSKVTGLKGTVGELVFALFVLLVWLAHLTLISFVVIWSLNTLFPTLGIAYTLWTLLATMVLTSTVRKSK